MKSIFPLSEKDRTDLYISIPVLLIALAFIVFYSFKDQFFIAQDDLQVSSKVELVKLDTFQYNNKEYISVPNTDTISSENISIVEIVENKSNDDFSNTIISTPKESNLTDKTIDQSASFAKDSSVHLAINNIDTIEVMDTSKFVPKERVFRATPTNTPNTTSATTLVTSKEDCIIVIGSFSKERNINRIIKSLTKDNYTIFQENKRGLKRIGIFHSCNQTELNNTLKTIQKDYAKDAIIYRPNN